MRKIIISLAIAVLIIATLGIFVLLSGPGRKGEPKSDVKSDLVENKAAQDPEIALLAEDSKAAEQKDDSAKPLLSGQVLDAYDNPVPGARVWVGLEGQALGREGFEEMALARALGRSPVGGGSQPIGLAVARADGYYAVRFVSIPKPGEYRVVARAIGFNSRQEVWWNTGEPTTLDFRLDEGGETIEGIVVDPAGTAIAGARVAAVPEGEDRGGGPPFLRQSRTETDWDRTDPAGKFRLVVVPGIYTVQAEARGYRQELEREVPAGAKDVRIQLEPGRRIAGRVVDEEGKGLAGALVSVYSREDRGRGPGGRGPGGFDGQGRFIAIFQDPVARVQSGEDGVFEFLDAPVTAFTVLAKKSGFEIGQESGWIPREGDVPPVEVKLKLGGILVGTVKDETGAPVAGALAAVREQDENDPGRGRGRGNFGREGRRGGPPGSEKAESKEQRAPEPQGPFPLVRAEFVAQADKEGRFAFDTLPRSVFDLTVRSERHVPSFQGGIEVLERVEVNVVVDSGIRLVGRVLGRPGDEAVPRASIRLQLGEGDRKTVQADADGRYAVQGLVPGRIQEIQVRAPGYTTHYVDGLEILADPREQTRDFTLDRAASLSGRVVSTKGEPVPRARVRVSTYLGENAFQGLFGGGPGGRGGGQGGPGGGGDPAANRDRFNQFRRSRENERSVLTDSAGAFQIENIDAGQSYQAIVTHPEYLEFRSDPFPVEAGAKIEGVLYTIRAGGKLLVWVVQPDGTALPNVDVELTRQRQEQPDSKDDQENRRRQFQQFQQRRNDNQRKPTASDGKATFQGLETALYTVQTRVNGFQPFRQTDIGVTEDQTTEFTANLLPENVITGVVMDSSGAPVPGARLSASSPEGGGGPGGGPGGGGPGGRGRGGFFQGDNTLSRAMAQEDGTFRLGNLGPGPYNVRASAQGFMDFTAQNAEVNRPLEISLKRLGSIEGQVIVAETGAPIPAFSVLLLREGQRADQGGQDPFGGGGGGGRGGRGGFRGPGGGQARDIQDPQGLFSIDEIEPGSYVLRVVAADLSPREISVRVNEGAVARVACALFAGIVVSGAVVDPAGAPLAGIDVVVIPAAQEGSQEPARKESTAGRQRGGEIGKGVERVRPPGFRGRGSVLASAQTDESGNFYLRDLQVGKYILVASHQVYVTAQKPFEIGPDGSAPEMRITLETGETLGGTVTGADRRPVAGANVMVRSSAGASKRAVTDAAGQYWIQGLQVGSYSVFAFGGQGQRSDRLTVEIKKGQNQYNISLGGGGSGNR